MLDSAFVGEKRTAAGAIEANPRVSAELSLDDVVAASLAERSPRENPERERARRVEEEGLEILVSDRPLPTAVRWTALGFNALLLFAEVGFLLWRWVSDVEVAMVSLLVATPVVNLVMFFDYYRRGLWTQGAQKVAKGDLRPLPTPIRWLAIAFNVLLMFSEAVLLLDRGVNLGNPLELLVTSLMVATPVVSLAMFLDYSRRGL